MKRIFLFLMLALILINPVNAQSQIQTLGCFEANTEINLVQTCASCTFNNISAVSFPNSSILISNVAMERDGARYNFTLNDTQTGTFGEYIYDGFGDLSGTDTSWVINFFITASGKCLDTGGAIVHFILILGVFLIFSLTLWGGIVLPFQNKRNEVGEIIGIERTKYFKIGLLTLSYVLFIWIVNLLFVLAVNFSLLTQYTNFLEIIFRILNSGAYVVFVIMFLSMMFLAWKDLKLRELLERGIRIK